MNGFRTHTITEMYFRSRPALIRRRTKADAHPSVSVNSAQYLSPAVCSTSTPSRKIRISSDLATSSLCLRRMVDHDPQSQAELSGLRRRQLELPERFVRLLCSNKCYISRHSSIQHENKCEVHVDPEQPRAIYPVKVFRISKANQHVF